MPNKPYAQEWLLFSKHDLKGAKLLFEAHHFTDMIARDLQQAIEKSLKAVLAFEDKKIPRTHDLTELAGIVQNYLDIKEDEFRWFDIATRYYLEGRYPNPNYELPQREEIKTVLNIATNLSRREEYHNSYHDRDVAPQGVN